MMDLYELHGCLVQREFAYGLTAKEEMRLNHIRWHLDQIEMEQLAPDFERLERFISERMALGHEIHEIAATYE